MEGIKLFATGISIIGALVVLFGVLYKRFMPRNTEDKRNEYTDIIILEGLFLFLYGLVSFYFSDLELRIFFVALFIVLQAVILIYRRNAAYWLTSRIVAIEKIIWAKETKVDTVYWMYTALIVVILVLLSLPYWINPDYPHDYLTTIYLTTGILLYIRAFLFKNEEGRISAHDVCTALLSLGFALFSYYVIMLDGFTAFQGRVSVTVLIIIFRRKPPQNSDC